MDVSVDSSMNSIFIDLHYLVNAGHGLCHIILSPFTKRNGTILVINIAKSLAWEPWKACSN